MFTNLEPVEVFSLNLNVQLIPRSRTPTAADIKSTADSFTASSSFKLRRPKEIIISYAFSFQNRYVMTMTFTSNYPYALEIYAHPTIATLTLTIKLLIAWRVVYADENDKLHLFTEYYSRISYYSYVTLSRINH